MCNPDNVVILIHGFPPPWLEMLKKTYGFLTFGSMVECSSLTDTQGSGLGCWWLDLRTSSTGKVHGIQSSWLAQVAGGGRPQSSGIFSGREAEQIYIHCGESRWRWPLPKGGDLMAICKGANTWEWLAISFRSVLLFPKGGICIRSLESSISLVPESQVSQDPQIPAKWAPSFFNNLWTNSFPKSNKFLPPWFATSGVEMPCSYTSCLEGHWRPF